MKTNVSRKMLLEGVIEIYRETCSIYDKLQRKSISTKAKKIFIKMHLDGVSALESYESIYNSLPDDESCGHVLETELPANSDMFKYIKVKWWGTREDALITCQSIEHTVLSQLTRLKNMYPGLGDDFIDDAVAREEKQLKFLVDVHYLQLMNDIMI